MSPSDTAAGPPPEQDADRGQDPARTVGARTGGILDLPDPDPGFTPPPDLVGQLQRQYELAAKRRRPHREDVLPYLLIRAAIPADRGARPTWPPVACWESPDILLIDAAYSGPFDPQRLVGSPVSGHAYRVFVRVFNLGLLPAVGVHVMAWYVEPGFFSGQPGYEAHHIGGAYVDLDDRTRPGGMRVVELDAPWEIPPQLTGHECLLAVATCVADPWSGSFDANHDRHVGQRNLDIAVGSADLTPLLELLDGRAPQDGVLEVLRGGAEVYPLLDAVAGGRLGDGRDERRDREGYLLLRWAVDRRSSGSGLLPTLVRRALGVSDLHASTLAEAMGGAGQPHLLRIVATQSDGALIGGYSFIVA